MITEHALLSVRPGTDAEFEIAFNKAKSIISSMRGFHGLTLSRCMENAETYLLLVEWERLEDHTEGFRGSEEYQEWRRLLHHFYSPIPTVEHYEHVFVVPALSH
ncbi:antibiotic biosynthesis monooxygenase [Arthrobacter sp. ISL-72]|uniref:antibiotic biosynthesis monooxygenase family protein n=1 Tax=Arthrobacter sp. ISL-72 TaxID=2819114 RepID=UPI001BEA21B2|nr:antibiotic biosynthesis monooxygenase [Arthrobacter sp. ISL-72]MBT2596438.1 antibiotic biosynthesis monooxygenase [Arthrobacter sp. ISL-72]